MRMVPRLGSKKSGGGPPIKAESNQSPTGYDFRHEGRVVAFFRNKLFQDTDSSTSICSNPSIVTK